MKPSEPELTKQHPNKKKKQQTKQDGKILKMKGGPCKFSFWRRMGSTGRRKKTDRRFKREKKIRDEEEKKNRKKEKKKGEGFEGFVRFTLSLLLLFLFLLLLMDDEL